MIITDHQWIENPWGTIEWIHRRVDTERCNLTTQYCSSIKVRKSCSRSRVSQVICRNVNGLYRCDWSSLCRGDSLLHDTHLCSKRRLVTYRWWHTSEKSWYFRSGLCKAEDIVDKEKDIAASCRIAEVTITICLLYTSPSPRDRTRSRMPSSAWKKQIKTKKNVTPSY